MPITGSMRTESLTGVWTIDPPVSAVAFRVRHFGFATVEGTFSRFTGTLTTSGASGSVDVASVDTGNAIRDERLRHEFFDVERFPQIIFEAAGPLSPVVNGLLTIRDVTRPLVLEVADRGDRADGRALRARGTVSRAAFGLDWLALREAGRLIVSDRVQVALDLVAVPA
jgi:polyisoprenoid-binding protein YceI